MKIIFKFAKAVTSHDEDAQFKRNLFLRFLPDSCTIRTGYVTVQNRAKRVPVKVLNRYQDMMIEVPKILNLCKPACRWEKGTEA